MNTKCKPVSFMILILVLLISGCEEFNHSVDEEFSGESALAFIETQLSFGPRIPGSEGHRLEREWIRQNLVEYGWDVEIQEFEYEGVEIFNIIASKPSNSGKERILLSAHYDSRIFADASTAVSDQSQPVPGANDGASGVAVLLELARVLPQYENLDVIMVFFDAEDNGYIDDWDWIVGSKMYASQLNELPDVVVVVDMIGDKEQEIYYEMNSDPMIREEIWDIADRKGVATFHPEEKYSMLDDHTPFIQLGIPSVLLIDFDYPYWHTPEDNLDKVSAESLSNVGEVLQEWLSWRDSGVPTE